MTIEVVGLSEPFLGVAGVVVVVTVTVWVTAGDVQADSSRTLTAKNDNKSRFI